MNPSTLTDPSALPDAAEKAESAVVRVEGGARSPGTGIAFGDDGLVVTNAATVEVDEGFELSFADGTRSPATLVGRDLPTDVAVVRAEKPAGAPLPARQAETLRRGELVLALARPGRGLRVALGLIGALGGEFRGPRGGNVEHYVEPALAAGYAFPGGALVDLNGALIGMTSNAFVRGTLIALPHVTLSRIVEALVTRGSVERGYLGVHVQPVRLSADGNGKGAAAYGLMVVGLEPGGPAERAGVLLGDILVTLEAGSLESVGDLAAALEARSGAPTRITLVRAGSSIELEVTPGARRPPRC
jgi:S1-C subfamily serine protease